MLLDSYILWTQFKEGHHDNAHIHTAEWLTKSPDLTPSETTGMIYDTSLNTTTDANPTNGLQKVDLISRVELCL